VQRQRNATELRWRSDSYNFNLGGDVQSDGRAVSGSVERGDSQCERHCFRTRQRDRIPVVARGDSFSSQPVAGHARQSTIGRDPAAGTEVSEVSITLSQGQQPPRRGSLIGRSLVSEFRSSHHHCGNL